MCDVGLLGCAIFQTIGTNISLLLSDPKLDPHIWSTIAMKCNQISSVHTRSQLRAHWFLNVDNVQGTYYAICQSEGIVTNRIDDDGSFEMDIMCACMPTQKYLQRTDIRLCSPCDHWIHTPCQQAALIPFGDVKWGCPKCSNSSSWKFNYEVTYKVTPTLDPFYGYSVVLQRVMPYGIFTTGVSFPEKISVEEKHNALVTMDVESCKMFITDSCNKPGDNPELPNSIDTFLGNGNKCVDLLRNDDMKYRADQKYSILSADKDDFSTVYGDEYKDDMGNFTESSVPVLETFSFRIEKSICDEIKPIYCNPHARPNMLRFKKRHGLWGTKFRDGLSSAVPLIEMKKCQVTFPDQEVKMREAAEYFMQVSGYCVRVGCSMMYRLTISMQPEPSADFVEVNVRASGNLSHKTSQREKRKPAKDKHTGEKKVCHDLSQRDDKGKSEILPQDGNEVLIECCNKLQRQNDPLEELICNDPLEDNSKPTEESAPQNVLLKTWEEIKVVPQNGTIEYQNIRYQINFTCSGDTVLQGIHALCKLNPASYKYLEELAANGFTKIGFLLRAIRCVDETKFDEAKEILYNEFLEHKFDVSSKKEYLDAFNSQEVFFSKMKDIICLKQDYRCPVQTCNIPKQTLIYPLVDTGFYNSCSDFDLSELFKQTISLDECDGSHSSFNKSRPTVELSWSHTGPPPFFIIPIPQEKDVSRIQESNLSLNISILGIRYKLCLYTVHYPNHFYNVVIVNDIRTIADGLHPYGLKDFQPVGAKHLISSMWFIRD